MLRSVAGSLTGVPPSPVTIPIQEGVSFDLDELLTIDAIRTHTKTEDIPSVTDEQLKLYRKAAFEQAELFTNLLLIKNIRREEVVTPPRRFIDDVRRTFTHRLKYAAAEPQVFVYGPGTKEMLSVDVGTHKVILPNRIFAHMVFDCCRPCSDGPGAVRIMYLAGMKSINDVPAGIIVGVLKYIAWSVSNPGDVLKTVDNRRTVGQDFMKGSNDAAWASGAIDEWRKYVREI